MSYLTLAVPIALQPTARLIALAFEPDGGVSPDTYEAFSLVATDADGNEWCIYGAPVEDWLAESASMWKASPEALQAAVVSYLSQRHPTLSPPTLGAVQSFTEALLLSTAYGVSGGLSEMGLSIVTE